MFRRRPRDEIPERILKKFNVKPEPLPKPRITHVNKLVGTVSIIAAIVLIFLCSIESGLEWLIGFAFYDWREWILDFGEELAYIIFGLVFGWMILTGKLDYKRWKKKWDP